MGTGPGPLAFEVLPVLPPICLFARHPASSGGVRFRRRALRPAGVISAIWPAASAISSPTLSPCLRITVLGYRPFKNSIALVCVGLGRHPG